jgi:hypothetical protein
MSAKTPKLLERPRNKLVFNPLLSKGGTHTKSKTGQRMKAKLSLKQDC